MKRPQCLILTTLTLRASIDTMFCDLADALRRQGVHTRVLVDAPQAPNIALAHGLVGDLRDYDGPRFIIDINAKSRLTARRRMAAPSSFTTPGTFRASRSSNRTRSTTSVSLPNGRATWQSP
jgi:hypothetical protein